MVKGGGLEKYWTESEVYRCQGGNQQLARKLVEAIGADARADAHASVRSIAVTDKSVRVTLASGKVLEGDHVILDRAAAGLEPDRDRSGAAGRPRAADGHATSSAYGGQRSVLAARRARRRIC